jgi:hypothetical protein
MVCLSVGPAEQLSTGGVIGFAADRQQSFRRGLPGFIARLDFGELARRGHMDLGQERSLSLALLLFRVFADHANHSATMNHLALVADLLD